MSVVNTFLAVQNGTKTYLYQNNEGEESQGLVKHASSVKYPATKGTRAAGACCAACHVVSEKQSKVSTLPTLLQHIQAMQLPRKLTCPF